MLAVDTNVLVRLITQDDVEQVSAAKAFIEKGAWVSVVSLAEAVWVLRSVYAKDRSAVIAAVEMLLNLPQVALQDSDAVAAALELFRSRPGLGFTDCLILELARKAGHLPLGTFDRALGKVSGAQRI